MNKTMECTVYYQNVRGIRTKASEFMSGIVGTSFTVLCLTETWLEEGISSSNYFPPCYSVFRRDRDYANTGQIYGGGVLTAVDASWRAWRRHDLESYSECVWVEIASKDGVNHLIGNYYFPPQFNYDLFVGHLKALERSLNVSNFRVQIYGDFNMPGIDWTLDHVRTDSSAFSPKALSLLDFIYINGFEQCNTIKNSAGNILDLVLVSSPIDSISLVDDPITRVDNFHPPFVVSFFFPPGQHIFRSQSYFLYSKGDYFNLYSYLQSYDWNPILKDVCVDSATEAFTAVVSSAMDAFIPKRVSRPNKYPSWFSWELKCCLRKKLHYHRLFKKSGLEKWSLKFSECRSLAKWLFKRDEKVYVSKTESAMYSNPKDFWKFVTSQRNKKSDSAPFLRDSSGCTSDPAEVANMFAQHFKSCFSSESNANFVSSCAKTLDFFAFVPIDELEIETCIRKIKPKLSAGADGIPSFIVKGCADLLSPVLLHIFNLSLRLGKFPSIWKQSVIVPIFKSGDRSIVKNYRPVSLLCSFSKVFEMTLHERLYNYFRQKICPEQHGFMKGKSVETNLCTFLDYIVPFVHDHQQVDVIYFDMSKAFDRVNHDMLLHKLDDYGLCSTYCCWFRSYLSSRRNFVRVSGFMSEPFFSSSGVPQGSNLGPLLFLCFVNDIVFSVKNSKVLLFADDIKLFRQVRSHSECALLQNDVCEVSKWCHDNNLLLNELKTKTISLSRKRDPLAFCYVLDSNVIERVSVIRDLGVFIDTALNFNHHVFVTCNASLRTLGALSRFTKQFSSHACYLRLFCCLVRSKLEFGSVVWNSLSHTASCSIERVQNRFIAIVYDRFFRHKWYYSYEGLLTKLGLSSLLDRRRYRDILFLYKVANGIVDSPGLLSSICFHAPSRSSRSHRLFYPLTFFVTSPLVRMQAEFNKIDSSRLDIFSDSSTFSRNLEGILLV